jgi:hypothetical protein
MISTYTLFIYAVPFHISFSVSIQKNVNALLDIFGFLQQQFFC